MRLGMKSNYLPITSVATIISGGTPKTSIPDYWDGNIPWLSAKDFNNDSKFVYSTEKHITELGLKNSSTNLLKADDIIISARGTVGKLAMIPFNMTFNQSCFGIRADIEKILPHYLYYALKNNIQTIKGSTHGSVFDTITLKDFDIIKINVPDLETQKKIVKVLSILDQKIELNNQLDLTVHNNLNAIFEDWFVRKNYNGNQSKWRKEKLGKFVTINRGLSYKGQFLSDSGTPMINLGNIMPGGIFRPEKNKYYTGEFKNKVVVKAGDLVMANTDMTQKREVLGTPLIVPSIYDGDVIFSHHIYSIKSEKIPTLFLYYLLLRKDFSDTAGGGATGTTVLFLPKDIIENYEFVLPDDAEINRFVDIAKKVLQRRNNIMHENMTLEIIRDTLLSRLMSGEIILEKVKI